MDEEQYLREKLGILRREYEKAAKPIIDRIARINAMKKPEPIYVEYARWAEMQDNEVLK